MASKLNCPAGLSPLTHVHINRQANAGISWIIQVISAIVIFDVYVICVIPVIGPVLWPWIDHGKPETIDLEAWKALYHSHGHTINAEPVGFSKRGAEAIVRNAVAMISAALLPIAVLGFPVTGAMLLPCSLLYSRVYMLGLR